MPTEWMNAKISPRRRIFMLGWYRKAVAMSRSVGKRGVCSPAALAGAAWRSSNVRKSRDFRAVVSESYQMGNGASRLFNPDPAIPHTGGMPLGRSREVQFSEMLPTISEDWLPTPSGGMLASGI